MSDLDINDNSNALGDVSQIPIEQLVPHDKPMALLDQMLEYHGDQSRCRVTITRQSPFAESDGVPAYVGIEYMAQAIAAHDGYRSILAGNEVKVGFLLGTPGFRSNCSVFPIGAVLDVVVEEDWGNDELHRFACQIIDTNNGNILQETGLNVFQPKNLEAYLSHARTGE